MEGLNHLSSSVAPIYTLLSLEFWSYNLFCFQNKALRSDKHRPVVHPEVILCVEIYQKTYASVKVYLILQLHIFIVNVKALILWSLPCLAVPGTSCAGKPIPYRSEGQHLLFDWEADEGGWATRSFWLFPYRDMLFLFWKLNTFLDICSWRTVDNFLISTFYVRTRSTMIQDFFLPLITVSLY